MKKKNDIKKIILSLLFYPGLFLLVFFGHISIKGFVTSAIPLILVYILSWVWYGKAANIYGIIILIILSAVFISCYVIFPLTT